MTYAGQANRNTGPYSAVVIGSGFGGLAAAIRLQAAGVEVTLLEKEPALGGRAARLEDQGYVFDVGPSVITAPAIIDSVFKAAGRRFTDYVDLVPLDPYYRVHYHDGTHLDYVGDVDRMRAQMEKFDPEDAANLDAFMDAARPIFDAVITDRLGSRPFTLGRMAGFVPKVMRLGAYKTVAGFVNRYFKNFRHRFMYSFHPLFLGGSPFNSPAVYLSIPYLEKEGGVWFSRGGMYSVVEAMESVFRELGGTVHVDAEVTSIELEGRRASAVHAKGQRFAADVVVSNADVGHLYRDLLPEGGRRRWSHRKVEKIDYTMSCFVLYAGVKKTYPDLAHHTLVLSERYRELVEDIFKRKVLAPDMSMYLHAPTRSDPSMAPPGCESLYALVPVPNLTADVDWSEARELMTERVIDALEEWGLDGLRENLEVLHVFDPTDFEARYNAMHGNAFGVEPKLTQTAWFRPHNRSEDIDGLYLVGAGTHPGAGVPGVILSAEATFGCIAEDIGLEPQWDWSEPGRVALGPVRPVSVG